MRVSACAAMAMTLCLSSYANADSFTDVADEVKAQVQAADATIASIHSDIAFALTTGLRQSPSCTDAGDCSRRPDLIAATRFDAKVKFVAAILESGVRELFPEIESRIPGSADDLFGVVVVESDEWKTASSASGRIAISTAMSSASSLEDFLAFAIAREMAHVIARHHEQNSTASILASLAMNVVVPGSAIVKSVVSLGSAAIASNASGDEQARQADALAVWILKASGYKLEDVAMATAMLQKTPSRERWSYRLAGAADYLVANVEAPAAVAPPVKVARASAPPRVQESDLARLRTAGAPVVSYVSNGAILLSAASDAPKVAASAGRRASYYDM